MNDEGLGVDGDHYDASTTQLLADRLRTGAACFLVFSAVAVVLDMTYFPERTSALLTSFAVYLLLCWGAARYALRQPAKSWHIALASSIALIGCMAGYQWFVRSPAEMALMPVVLFLCATTTLLPWGAKGQLTACIGALVALGIFAMLGMPSLLPLPYTLGGVAAVGVVTVPTAGLFERQRHDAWLDRQRAWRAERGLQRLESGVRKLHDLGPTNTVPHGTR